MPRMAVPKSWPIERKISRWIMRPICGPHAIENCLPLGVILKEILIWLLFPEAVPPKLL